MVDSDDLVSNRIAEYVNSHPGRTGFLSRYGYVHNEGTGYVQRMLALHRTCGSCSIVNYAIEDLPEQMPEDFYDDSIRQKWIFRKSHRLIPDYLKEHGRKQETMPFPTTIYVMNTGDNHSILSGNTLNWKRRVEMMLQPRIEIKRVSEEFGILPS